MKTTFYLIRHGETEWNLNGRWQGHADIPLNELGRAQARRLAERISTQGPRFDAVFSSDLQRAWETASIMCHAIDMVPQPLVALREIDVGTWSGLTGTEVRERDGDTYARIQSGEDVARGGAERFLDLYSRVVGAVEQLARTNAGQTLALVSHGGAVRAVLLHAARNKDGMNPYRIHIGNTAITVVMCENSTWELGAINDMAHLEASPHAHDMMSAPPDDTERP